jgi:NADH-quinone oxidoreductase subunit A
MFFLSEYSNIALYALVSGALAGIILFLAYIISILLPDTEKLSTYECGFDPFTSVREKTSVHFYLISILFLIFDIEIIFLFPWTICSIYSTENIIISYIQTMIFIWLITIGFFYEWLNEALNW